MIRIREENINTVDFWNHVWEQEHVWKEGTGLVTDRWEVVTEGLRPPAKVLDVGGGRGEFLAWLGDAYDRTLLDHSRYAVDLALAERRVDLGVVGDALDLPFVDDTFDATYCCELLEHVEDPQALVDELHRVTKPDGLVGISTPYADMIPDQQHVWIFHEEDVAQLFWRTPEITLWHGQSIIAVALA